MKIIHYNYLNNSYKNFVNASRSFETDKYSKFSNSYVTTCSNVYVSRMKSVLSNKYKEMLEAYQKIDEWWLHYLNDVRAVENAISQSFYGFEESSLASFVGGKLLNPTVTKTSLSGKLTLATVNSELYSNAFMSMGSASPFLAQSMFEQKVLFSKQEKEMILNKFFNGSNLTASEVNKIQSTLTHMYDEDMQKANQKCEASQTKYNDMAKVFSKLTGSSFDIDKMKSLKSEAQQEALRMAKEYKSKSFRWNDFDFDEKGIHLTRDQFEKMSVTELSEVLLKNDMTIGTQYKRFNSILSGTQYGSLENFLKKMSTLQDNYSKDLEAKNKIEAQVKGLSYALMSQTEDYKNFKPKSVSKDGITDVTTVIQNDQNIATQQTIVDYSKYVKTYGEVDPLSFTSLAMQMYGDSIEVQGVTNPELLKELAKVQGIQSLSDMGKYYQFAYQNFGSEKANKYLTDYESEIHQYCGEVNANEFLNHLSSLNEVNRVEAVTNHLKVTGKGLSEGMMGFFSNLGYLLESPLEENRTVSAKEYENMYIVQALSSKESKMKNGLLTKNLKGDVFSTSDIIDYTKDYGALTEHNYQISESIGNMLPSIAVSAINPFVGSLALGASAAGGSYHSAMTEGYSVQKSMLYGVASGASEVLMEKALGGLPLLSDTKVVSLKTMAQAMGKEFNEEFIQTYVDAGASSLILQKDFDLASTSKEALQSGIYGGITGGIMNLPSLAINSSSIKMIDNQIKAGKVSQEEIVQSFHELIPETQQMNYDEILQEYTTTAKDVTLSLVQANGKTVASSGVSTLLGNMLKNSQNALHVKMNQIRDKNIVSLNLNPIQNLEPAFVGVQNITDVEQVIVNNSDVNKLLGKTALSSLPKAVVGIATSFASRPFFFRYTPVTTSNSFSQKILNEGLYHFTSEKSISKIQESGYIKASDYFTSYGNKKSFFFAGIPDIEDVAMNTSSLADKRVAVKLKIDPSELQQFRYRDLVDKAVSHDGNYVFNPDHFSIAYLGLAEENGKVVYKEISKSEYDQYQSNVSKAKKESLVKKAETFIIGVASDWTYTKNRFQRIASAFKNTNIDKTGAIYANSTSMLLENIQQFNLEDTLDLEEEGLPIRDSDHFTNLEDTLDLEEEGLPIRDSDQITNLEDTLDLEEEGLPIRDLDQFTNLEDTLDLEEEGLPIRDSDQFTNLEDTLDLEEEGLPIRDPDRITNLEDTLDMEEEGLPIRDSDQITNLEDTLDMEEEGLPIRDSDQITNSESLITNREKAIFKNDELLSTSKFLELSLENKKEYIQRASIGQINELISSDISYDDETSQLFYTKIFHNQEEIFYDKIFGKEKYSNIEKYVCKHPELYSDLHDESLITLIDHNSKNTDLLNELYRRIDEGSPIFMKNYEVEEFYGRKRRIIGSVFNAMSQEYQKKVRDSIIELSKKISPDLKKLSLSGYDMFDQAQFFYALQNNTIDEVGIQFLNKLCSENKYKFKGMNYSLLNSSYLNDLGEDFVKSIINKATLANQIVYLHNYNPSLYQAFVKFVQNSYSDNSLYTFYPKVTNMLSFFIKNEHALVNLDSKLLLSDSFTNYVLYLASNAYSNSIKLSAFSSDYNTKFYELCDDKFLNLYLNSFTDVNDLKKIFYNKYFSSDVLNIKSFITKYETSLDSISKYDEESVAIIKYLKFIESINDKETLKNLYDECNIRISSEELLYIDDALRKAYVKTYIESLEKTNHTIESLIKSGQNTSTINFEGKNVTVVDVGNQFSFIVRSSDSGLVTNGLEHVSSYKDAYFQADDPTNHILAATYINERNIGSCPVNNEGVLYGFTKLNDSQIVMMAPNDINSNINSVGYSSGANQRFVTADDMSSYTRRIYNEVDLEKNGTLPDYVIIYNDSTDTQIQSAYKAAIEWNIPVIRIDKVDVATHQSNFINSLMENFKETKDVSYLDQALDLYESNCSGYKFNSFVKEGNEDRTSGINNQTIYDLGLFNSVTIEDDILDYIHELTTMDSNQKEVDELIKVLDNVKYKYDLANESNNNLLANTKSNLDLESLEAILEEIRR